MSVFETPKYNYNASTAVGASDLNRIELNIYKLITLHEVKGTFTSVTTSASSYTTIATMILTFPLVLVSPGTLYIDFKFNVTRSLAADWRFYNGSNYSVAVNGTGGFEQYLAPIALASTITLTVQGKGYYNGSTWDSCTFSKTDPYIMSYFTEA